MLTDLRLRKYLEGLLSPEEAKEVEVWLEKSPEMRERLEVLKAQGETVGRPTWHRVLLGKKTRRGARVRTTLILPLLLAIAILFTLANHWFSRPGENSTFTLAGGNGTAIEVLYGSASGWRFLDAGFRAGDSLSFSVRDTGRYHVEVMAVFGEGAEARVVSLWRSGAEQAFDKSSPKPTFASGNPGEAGDGRPGQILVFYDDSPLPELPPGRVLDIVETQGNERGGLDFQYQVFASGP